MGTKKSKEQAPEDTLLSCLKGNMVLRCSLLIRSLGYVDMESNNLCASVTSILLEYRSIARRRRPSWYD